MAKILIVEDEPKHRKYMNKAIAGEGREITEAKNEDEALAMELEYFDVIVSDIVMKAKDGGMKVLRAAMQSSSPPYVILITAFGDAETGPNAMSEGAFDYLEKGMQWPRKLAQVVDEALSEIEEDQQ